MVEKAKTRGGGGRRRQSSTTIRTVAERARVSIATVSHVMNQTRYVRPETRKRVLAVAADLGYAPVPSGKALRHGAAGTLGLLVTPDAHRVDDPISLGALALQISAVAAEERFSVLFEPMRRHRDHELATPRIVADQRAGGVLVIGPLQAQDIDVFLSWATPICAFGTDGAKVPAVNLNHQAGMRDAVQYLAALGHKRIALVLTAADDPSNQQKKTGFLETAREFGLEVDPKLIVDLPADQPTFAGGRRATLKLLEGARPPTAICYASDWVALGGLRAADEQGLRVPQHLSIIGFNDSILSRQSEPALTTLQFDPAAAARAAIDLLRRQIQERTLRDRVVEIRPRLIRRDSCAAAAGSA